jgi:hypothetical protein
LRFTTILDRSPYSLVANAAQERSQLAGSEDRRRAAIPKGNVDTQ